MQREQLVHLEWEGNRQTLHIPHEFELSSDEAMLRKEGERLIIEPRHRPSLLAYLVTLKPIEDEFPDVIDSHLPTNGVEK